ncbi:SCP2 sterol-binding domain-containing protein [Oceanobacillus indicireducens]|uniref:SCP2 domain-containing protein n=1 Tax=Oceanobacillus indicireducens TaxID=1004261 RepID=A0A917XU45_9BACI|nr:SCP2 sterol-binding domain-containing protein [Oceanobacillus indicireducens]GGN51746.1 hypothetical protein GCM10007971_06570 [Oceanobacillus indicireducens]
MSEEYVNLHETMQKIEKVINKNPEPIKDLRLIYQFDITGTKEESYQLYLQGGEAKVTQESNNQPDCTLKMSIKNFYKFLTGNLGGTMAFMTGKLKIDGDITKAMKLESLLKQYNFE